MAEIKPPLKVFLYHAPVDKVAVRDLYLRLIKDGVDTWLVKEKILPSQDWKEEISNAVREADVVVVCMSERFIRADSRQKEVQVAFDSVVERLDGEKFVIPVRLEECDGLENLRKWQRVDLFEHSGYERLMAALQAQADEIGAIIEAKESSLPQIAMRSVKQEQPSPEERHVEPGQAILETREGTGILIEGPAVKLQGPRPHRKLIIAMVVALLGSASIMVAVMFRSPWFQRWYQLAVTSLDATQTPTPGTQASPVVTPQMKPIPTLSGKGNVSHIVFLIDTSASMGGQRIRMVKSAASELVSRLTEGYLVSVIEFDTNVELRVPFSLDQAATREAIESIDADTSQYSSCMSDALYAGVQQASLISTAMGSGSMIILLTDVAPGESSGSSCSIHRADDFITLELNHSVPIFSIYVGNNFNENSFTPWMTSTEGVALEANTEKELDNTLLSISKAAGLKLHPEPQTFSQAKDAWQIPMVFVPPGGFIMGNNTVHLDSFWIDKTEVTNAMYAKCVQAGTCSPPRSNASHTRETYYGNPQFDDYPVIYISWMDAQNYCAWAGGRLPTEAEWEKAARGTDGRQFPWGDQDPSGIFDLLNYHAQDTTQVGSFPNGASPYGALDMAGNVSEWVADWLSLDYYTSPPPSNPLGPDSGEYRVWRGGSWANTSIDRLHTYSRTGNFPTDTSGGIGFRCARDGGQ